MDREKFISENIKKINENISAVLEKCGRERDSVSLMAVTKTQTTDDINFAVKNGIALLGENRVQEFLEKKEGYNLPKNDIHFIGHLQTNKVKYIINNVGLIESVSSLKLLKEIDRQAELNDVKMKILLEVNISREESKSGFFEEEIDEAIACAQSLKNVELCGLMCIPSKENPEEAFKRMKLLFDKENARLNLKMEILSMGMSDDYEKAIMYGSNLIRLGRAIFGSRN